MKRTFSINEGSFGYPDSLDVVYLRRRPVHLSITLSDFLESIADGGIRNATSVTVSTSPLEGSTLLMKLGKQKGHGRFRTWSTGSMEVSLCVAVTSKLFPRARKLWVVVK